MKKNDNQRVEAFPPKTGQTGQKWAKLPWFEMASDENGEWHWMLWSGNGKPSAQNVTPFPRQNDCKQAIINLIDAFRKQTIRLLIDAGQTEGDAISPDQDEARNNPENEGKEVTTEHPETTEKETLPKTEPTT